MQSQAMKTAAVLALIYRIAISGLFLLVTSDLSNPALKWTMLAITSIIFTFGLYRFVRMMSFANKLKLYKRVGLDDVN